MKKLVIFDLDGTLVNSIQDLANAVNFALVNMGFPTHDIDKYRYFIGNGTYVLCQRALPENHRSKDNTDALHEMFSQHYSAHFADNTYAYDGIVQLLRDIKSKGINVAVATNKPDVYCKGLIDILFKNNLIDDAIGSNIGFEKKPAPETTLELMRRFKANCEQTLFVGDSDVDIITAKNAGVKSVGCLWGFRTQEELLSAGADYIATTPNDILNCI